MRRLLISLALAAAIVPSALAQGVTPGGGVGRPLPRCSAIQPVCESRCRTERAQCDARPGANKQQCAGSFSNCLKRCLGIQCIR